MWEKKVLGTDIDTVSVVYDIHFTGPNHGWIAGWYGNLFRTTDNGGYPQKITHKRIKSLNTQFSVNATPSQQAGKIDLRYTIGFKGRVAINLYNLQGKHITCLVDCFHTKGLHYISFKGVTGTYLVELKVYRDLKYYHTIEKFIITK